MSSILSEQWGKVTIPQNEYLIQDISDLTELTPVFGDRVYIISTQSYKIYGESGWVDIGTPISTHNNDAGAHVDALAPFRRPLNGLYDGVDLSTVFANAAAFRAAIAAQDFSKIKVWDYWPLTVTGTFRDVSSYTVPIGTTYYSDTGLTTSVGTTSVVYEGLYSSVTAVSITISSVTYYVAIGGCLAYFVRTLNNAVIKCEVAAINPYIGYGDTSLSSNHVIMISRDCIPTTLKMRAANDIWYVPAETNPWLGSALYETLNNPTNGLLTIIAATDIGAYIHAGPNNMGMRWLGEVKAPGVSTPTSWAWRDRGKLFLPFEPEVWGQSVVTENIYCKGITNQLDIFRGSTRHIVKGLGNGGSRCAWWCASTHSSSDTAFAYVNSSGNPHSSTAVNARGVPTCFLIS